jgi:hypothetical protein
MATVGQISRVNTASLGNLVSGQKTGPKQGVAGYSLKDTRLASLTAAGNSLGLAAVLGGTNRPGLELCNKVRLLTINACNDNRSTFVSQIEDMCLESVA